MKDNLLINETSLYLLQHAKNPVNWHPWSEKVFKKAKKEKKLVLVSIGYSSCHWCHVMEKESFEDQEVARVMNANFISIKVDREERPDVDQLYMSAIQLMGVRGGWPLNCFVLPDGRPIYGGTYFNKAQWVKILEALSETYENQEGKVEEYAQKIQALIENNSWLDKRYENVSYSSSFLEQIISTWSSQFDEVQGGFNYVPKFPMPSNFISLLHWAAHSKDTGILAHIKTTLLKMSYGGIYDQISGGFSRYSTDARWKVPHFEKMLYDNAQLIELYSDAYIVEESEEFRQVVYGTFEWLYEELKTPSGPYFCSLDADSDGEEGAYYCWSENELKMLLKEEFSWFKEYFNIHPEELWEKKYILFKTKGLNAFARHKSWTPAEFQKKLNGAITLLAEHRSKRNRPLRDTKCLTSWNALLIKGLCKAYIAFGDERFIDEANQIASWICTNQIAKDKTLKHNFVDGKPLIDGFLEDYAFVIDSFIMLYQLNGNLKLLQLANQLTETVERDFYSNNDHMCYYTNSSTSLFARKFDVEDDVIPSSNSVMAHNFLSMGTYYRNEKWILISHKMIAAVLPNMSKFPTSYSNWFLLYFKFVNGITEISVGSDNAENSRDIHRLMYPLRLISYHQEIPMSSEFDKGIYVCTENTCWPKINSIKELVDKLTAHKNDN